MNAPDPLTVVVPQEAVDDRWVTARLVAGGYHTTLSTRGHALDADEPGGMGGADLGPTPYELLIGALAACTAMTVRMYANRKGWPLQAVVVRLRPVRGHAADCERCETEDVGAGRLEREIAFTGALTDEQRARLLYLADRCPVKQTLERGLHVVAASPSAEPRTGHETSTDAARSDTKSPLAVEVGDHA
jgi:putative redox protein